MKTITSNSKSKFEDTPGFNMWRDRDDIVDVENQISKLRKPIDLGMTNEEIDSLFTRNKDMGRNIDLFDV